MGIFKDLLDLFNPGEENPSLSGLTATVFVREANGSRTNLEHHLEQALIERGARVVLASQQTGMNLLKQGGFSQLAADVNFAVLGVLIVRSGFTQQRRKVWAETEYEFERRRAEFEAAFDRWKYSLEQWVKSPARPVFEPRRSKWEEVRVLHYQFSFRLIGSDGALLASGSCESFPEAGRASYDETLRELAREAVGYLDRTNVWERIVIA